MFHSIPHINPVHWLLQFHSACTVPSLNYITNFTLNAEVSTADCWSVSITLICSYGPRYRENVTKVILQALRCWQLMVPNVRDDCPPRDDVNRRRVGTRIQTKALKSSLKVEMFGRVNHKFKVPSVDSAHTVLKKYVLEFKNVTLWLYSNATGCKIQNIKPRCNSLIKLIFAIPCIIIQLK
jgi:hypothetical protein